MCACHCIVMQQYDIVNNNCYGIVLIHVCASCVCVRVCRVYFRISLKRGKYIETNFKGGGANTNQEGGSHIKYRESQFPRGGGAKAPPGPP
jgi:hypothetical protein